MAGFFLVHSQPFRDDLFAENGCIKPEKTPSFAQFLKFLTQSRPLDYNPHWKNVGSTCAPCVFDYDVIIKLESASEEEQYVMQK